MTASHCTSGHKSVKSRIKNASRDLAQFNSCCVQSFALNYFQLLWSTKICSTCTLYSIFQEFSHNDIKNVCLFCRLIILLSKYKMFSLIFQKGKCSLVNDRYWYRPIPNIRPNIYPNKGLKIA